MMEGNLLCSKSTDLNVNPHPKKHPTETSRIMAHPNIWALYLSQVDDKSNHCKGSLISQGLGALIYNGRERKGLSYCVNTEDK